MKNELRSFFASVKGYIVMKPFLKMAGIPESSFSLFMKGEMFDYQISTEKLIKLRDYIVEFCEKIA